MTMGTYNVDVVNTLTIYEHHIPTLLECLCCLKIFRVEDEIGVCGNLYILLCDDIPNREATDLSHNLCKHYTGDNFPIEDFIEHRNKGTLWVGDQLKQRLQLIDELIEVCERFLKENDE